MFCVSNVFKKSGFASRRLAKARRRRRRAQEASPKLACAGAAGCGRAAWRRRRRRCWSGSSSTCFLNYVHSINSDEPFWMKGYSSLKKSIKYHVAWVRESGVGLPSDVLLKNMFENSKGPGPSSRVCFHLFGAFRTKNPEKAKNGEVAQE